MEKSTRQDLPEAPASVTARVVSDQGFHLLFTLRDTTVSGLINKFEEFQKHVLSRGWKPETKNGLETGGRSRLTAQQISAPRDKAVKASTTTESVVCQVCGAVAVKKSGLRKDGTRWEGIFCSTGDESHKVWLS